MQPGWREKPAKPKIPASWSGLICFSRKLLRVNLVIRPTAPTATLWLLLRSYLRKRISRTQRLLAISKLQKLLIHLQPQPKSHRSRGLRESLALLLRAQPILYPRNNCGESKL